MIIVDFSAIFHANVNQMANYNNGVISEGLLKHMVLNSLRFSLSKHRQDGELVVIACDDKEYWRKDRFPYYKAGRRKAREETTIDWALAFSVMNDLKVALRESFGYIVIQTEKAEADDIIGTLAMTIFQEIDRVLIISGDKDFQQLQRYPWVSQYDPIKKKFIECKDPVAFLKEQLIRGDAGDGVPNFLSDDDQLVTDKRAKPISKRLVEDALKTPLEDFVDYMGNNMERNSALIDLTRVPLDITTDIHSQFINQKNTKHDATLIEKYLEENNLQKLKERIKDFIE